MKPRYVTVGQIGPPHGVDGSVKVKSLTDVKERFRPAARFFIAPPFPSLTHLTVEKVKGTGEFLFIKFKEINSRKKALELKGRFLQIPCEESPELPVDSYWIYEICGLSCYTENGKYLGKVEEVIKTGSNDVFVIKKGKQEILVPALKEIILEVNLEDQKLIIRPCPGLLEES